MTLSHSASEGGALDGAHKNASPPPAGSQGNAELYPPSIAAEGRERVKNGRVGAEVSPPHVSMQGNATFTASPARAVNAGVVGKDIVLDGESEHHNERALDDPAETFLDSLHLDPDQLSDFANSEGHFLYLRQKPGTDATAYNLEVNLVDQLLTNKRGRVVLIY